MNASCKRPLALLMAVALLLSCCAITVLAAPRAVLSPQTVLVDGEQISAEIYNVDGYNYVKLRDVASAVNGTDSQFEVSYDAETRSINVELGTAYTPVGGELDPAAEDKSASCVESTQTLYIGGEAADARAYNIGGNNYFSIADLGELIGFGVRYEQSTNRVYVSTTQASLGIISAMDVELAALVDATEVTAETIIGGNTFYEGTLNGVDVVLVKAGIGKSLAASCTETLIDMYDVGGIVFTGIAGGVGDEANVMDMVIATELVQHDYGTETNDGFEWNGNAGADTETGMIPVDETLSAMAYASACEVLGEEKVHQGVIATGDQFISSESYVAVLQEKFDALACEMEGAAVARIAYQYGVPCAVLRCMSDKADGLAHDTYAFNYTEASNTSAQVVMDMLSDMSQTGMVLYDTTATPAKDTTPRTAVISAMSVELTALVEAAEVEKEVVIGGNTFYLGTLNGEEVVLVKGGVGKVLAAGCTAALLNNFTVERVIFTGVAGGVGDETNVMDMVIGTSLVIHDYGTETNDGFVWNGEGGVDTETGLIPVDEELSALAYASACKIAGEEKVHQGLIATGDQFISSESYVATLQEAFDALACEMEGAAVARVCAQFGVPCAILRCMSDKADGLAHDTYAFNLSEAADMSAAVVMDMLTTLAAQ